MTKEFYRLCAAVPWFILQHMVFILHVFYEPIKRKSMSRPGRDDARERIKKAAPSHTTQTHQAESAKNKKTQADLKADVKRGKRK